MKTKLLLCSFVFVGTHVMNTVSAQNCQAGFTLNTSNNVVTFTNTSTGGTPATSYAWNFGDGNYSNQTNPSHTYQYNGIYYICLTMGDSLQPCFSYYCDTIVVTGGINEPCQANFYSYVDSSSNSNTVYFSNASTGNPISWSWSFGDNTTSSLQNPVHQYAQPGVYNVCLTIGTSYSTTCTYCDTVVVTGGINPPCDAKFYSFPDSLSSSHTVYFSDVSTGNPISWSWSFGDNSTSSLQNPVHQYAQQGVYNVCLTILTSDSTSCTYCDTVIVTGGINPPCDANFYSLPDSSTSSHTTYFFDASTGNPISWQWNFGDGNYSTNQNPVHHYNQPGTYSVCLTIVTKQDSINDTCTYCNTVVIDSIVVGGCNAVLYLYQDSSIVNSQTWYMYPYVTGYAPFSYLWNFGDGNTSTQQYPIHTYAVPGHYIICLTITDTTGCTFTTCDSTYRITSQGIIGTLVVLSPFTSVDDYVGAVNSIYPNPASETLSVSFNKFIQGELRILDMAGREVRKENINTNNVKVDVSNLPVGFYDLSVFSGDKISHSKIVIMR